MKKYRKKPVVVEAVEAEQWTGGSLEPMEAILGDRVKNYAGSTLLIEAPGGPIYAVRGDYVVVDASGIKVMRPRIFEATYEVEPDITVTTTEDKGFGVKCSVCGVDTKPEETYPCCSLCAKDVE